MKHSLVNRSFAGVTAGLAVVSLSLAAGCSSSDSKSNEKTSTTTTKAGSTATTAAAASSDGDTGTTEVAASDDKGKEIGNSDIKAALSESDPDLWALIDYNVMSWDAFNGFTIPVSDQASADQLMSICEKVSDIVYGGGSINDNTAIAVATGVSMDNLVGTVKVTRENKDGSCEAAA